MLVENARKGKSKYALGDGKNVADFTFVGNVAHAHLLAAEKVGCLLVSLSCIMPFVGATATGFLMQHITTYKQLGAVEAVAGQAFFVTNDAPLPFWDFLAAVLTGFGYPAPRHVHI